jgi:hypothetical protein
MAVNPRSFPSSFFFTVFFLFYFFFGVMEREEGRRESLIYTVYIYFFVGLFV